MTKLVNTIFILGIVTFILICLCHVNLISLLDEPVSTVPVEKTSYKLEEGERRVLDNTWVSGNILVLYKESDQIMCDLYSVDCTTDLVLLSIWFTGSLLSTLAFIVCYEEKEDDII